MPKSQSRIGGGGRRGADLYLLASGVSQISALLRYVVLARMLGPAQLGLAATLVLTASFFDLISDTGSDRFLIQDPDGDRPEVQRLVQLVYIGRGVSIALALVIFAWPIALFYRAPELAKGLAILALSPLILGFQHLDMRRYQRRLDYRAEAISQIVAESASVLATVLAAWLTRSFTAILYGVILRAVLMVAVSHLRAERPYRIGLSPTHSARLARFAAPLMFNGLLLYLATQGDRALVGNRLGIATLGRYSAVLLLIYYPAAMVLRYLQAMYLPLLAASRDDPEENRRVVQTFGGQTLLLGLGMSAGFALVAPQVVTSLYGGKFTQSALIIALIGILQSCRFMIIWPTLVALSLGRSAAALAVNVVRLVAYPAALVGGWVLGGLAGVVSGFIFGELVAQSAGVAILNQGSKKPIFSDFDRIAAFVLASAAIEAWVWVAEHRSVVLGVGLFLVSALLTLWIVWRERLAIRASYALARDIARRALQQIAVGHPAE